MVIDGKVGYLRVGVTGKRDFDSDLTKVKIYQQRKTYFSLSL